MALPVTSHSAITYGYDSLGRLVQATDDVLNIVITYTYDAGGNLTSVSSGPLSTLAIGDLSSSQGAVGSTLTVYGSGFSTTAANNTVQINGTTATVISATVGHLIVQVPTGATSGPITVQTGSSTVTSAGTFSIVAASGPPVIAAIPGTAAPGTTIQIQGSGFDANSERDKVYVNGLPGTVIGATPSLLSVLLPTTNLGALGVVDGPVTVTTPSGTATSSTNLLISAVTISSASGVGVDGSPVTVTTSPSGYYYAVVFPGVAGQTLALTFSDDSGDASVTVSGPDGTQLAESGGAESSGSLQIPVLSENGNYVAVIYDGAAASDVSLSVFAPVSGSLALNGSPFDASLDVAGQAAQLTFDGTAGELVALQFSNVTLTAATVTVVNPDGSTLEAVPLTSSGLTLFPQLPQSGTYSVQVVPGSTVSGSFTASLSSAASPSLVADRGPVAINGSSMTLPLTLNFEGLVGQYLTLTGTDEAGTDAITPVILNPDGTQLVFGTDFSTCPTCSPALINLGPLPQNGTYSLVFPASSTVGGTLEVALWSPVSVDLDTTSAVTIPNEGQSVAGTFAGTAGQYFSAAFTYGGAALAGTLTVLAPDGSVIATQNTYLTSNPNNTYSNWGAVSVGPLLSSGIYTALLQQGPLGAISGSASFTAAPALQDTLTVGTESSFTLLTGQGLEATFDGTAGQNVTIAVYGGGAVGQLSVLDPTRTSIAVATYTVGQGAVSVPSLPQTGTYTFLAQQEGGSQGPPGSGGLYVLPSSPVTGSLASGSQSNITLGAGQGFSETISGTAGQTLDINLFASGSCGPDELNNCNIPGAGAIAIYGPSGRLIGQDDNYAASCQVSNQDTECAASGSLNVGPLASTGTYTVVFDQTFPTGGLITVAPQLETPIGGAITAGTPETLSLAAGQGIAQSFSGSVGQYPTLSVSESNGAIQTSTVSILDPNGTIIASNTLNANCANGSACSGSTTLNLGPLAYTGNYQLIVQQPTGATGYGAGSLRVTLTDITPGIGVTTSFSDTTAGQAAHFTFSAAANQSLNLALSAMTFTPSANAQFAVQIIDSGGNSVYYNSSAYASTPIEMTLPAFSESGTFTLMITPMASTKVRGTATLTTAVQGVLTVGTPQNLTLKLGQAASLTFDETTTQTLALKVSGVTTNPAGASYEYMVAASNGALVAVGPAAGATTLNLPSLPPDEYTVSVQPDTPIATASMTVELLEGTADTVSVGGSTAVTTNVPGENAYVSFPGTFGQNVSVVITNLTFTPSSVGSMNLQALNSLNTIPNTSCSPPGCVVHLGSLVGTQSYSLTATPQGLATMSFTVNIVPDLIGTLAAGTPFNLSLSQTGQAATLQFPVTALNGGNPSLYIANEAPSPGSASYLLTILPMDNTYHFGAPILQLESPLDGIYPLPHLPVGTYQVIVQPSQPATSSLQLTLEPPINATLPSSGAGVSVSTSVPGQPANLSFQGTSGQSISVDLNSLSFAPSGYLSLSMAAAAPDGTPLGTTSCYVDSGSCDLELGTLTETGAYTVTVTPSASPPVTMSFAANQSSP